MASAKDLKKRISTVKNTQQTTKAMKMVSAAKLRRSQENALTGKVYVHGLNSLVRDVIQILAASGKTFSSPLVAGFPEQTGKALIVVVSSDRGLCGGFNANLFRFVQRWAAQSTFGLDYLSVGRKAFDFFKIRIFKDLENLGEVGSKVTLARSKEISLAIATRFLSGKYDRVLIAYNEFKNAAVQKPIIEQLFPLTGEVAETVATPPTPNAESLGDIQTTTSPESVLDGVLDHIALMAVHKIMLESQAGEHGARMTAMENATKNAGEMIHKLTLQYNKQRQAGITKELLEIIAGSESQNQAN